MTGKKRDPTRSGTRRTTGGVIAQRERPNETQRPEAEYFRALIENSMDSITILNADGTLRWESPSTAGMLGYKPGEAVGRTSFELVHPDDMPKVSDALSRLLQNPGGTEHLELRIKHSDDSWHTLDVVARNLIHDPVVAGIVINQRDITERKRAEEELSRSEEKLRLMFDSVSDGVAVTDLEATITEVNDKAVEMYGASSKDELLGRSAFELVAPCDREKAMLNSSRVLEQGSQVNLEYTLARADGSEYPGELSASLLKDASGSPAGFVAVVRDISERKKADEEKRRTDEQRHLTARLATVGQLAAGVAHELNNPLAAVQGFAQLLADRKDLEESIRSDVDAIYSEAKRASKITANLLSFARKHQPEKSFISINDVLEKSLELHAYRMRVNNIEVHSELAADLPLTMADLHQMLQVVVNIITNAEQAMTEAHGKGKLSMRSDWSGDTIRVTLADDGPGIPQADLERIFDPFYTTKEVGKGTGLGLDICRGIIEGHGGQLHARSTPGGGTTFVIEIPVVSADDAMAQQADKTHAQ